MNAESTNIPRTNKTTTTVIIGLVTLALGLVVGLAAAKSGSARTTSGASSQTSQLTASTGSPQSGTADEWNPFQQMREMQAQMDRMFNQMNQQFQGAASVHGFTDIPGYSLSLDVRDLKNRYEVHAWLPDAKASDVHVSLQNNQTLKVEVNQKQTETSGQKNLSASTSELSQYEQVVQLPTPVKAAQMKINRQGKELIITIPKAS